MVLHCGASGGERTWLPETKELLEERGSSGKGTGSNSHILLKKWHSHYVEQTGSLFLWPHPKSLTQPHGIKYIHF